MESQENQYRWPKAEAIYPDRPGRSYALKRLRYRLRSFLHQGSIVHFEQFINQHPFLVTLFVSILFFALSIWLFLIFLL